MLSFALNNNEIPQDLLDRVRGVVVDYYLERLSEKGIDFRYVLVNDAVIDIYYFLRGDRFALDVVSLYKELQSRKDSAWKEYFERKEDEEVEHVDS